jgi:hypothetical protein
MILASDGTAGDDSIWSRKEFHVSIVKRIFKEKQDEIFQNRILIL